MYYLIKDNKIILFDENRHKLEKTIEFMPQYKNSEILETAHDETIVDFKITTNEKILSELFEKAKEQKLSENLLKAYKAEENGEITFKNALFETSTANTSKLTAQFAMIQAGIIESVQWLSKDDKQVELTGEDIITLGSMIAEYTSTLWNVHYLSYKEMIDAAQTIDELNVIEINYTKERNVENDIE